METSRESIIRAAMEGVRRYGLDGVTMRRIAELAGLSAGNTYVYFGSKDALLRACFERVDRQIAQLFDGVEIDPEAVLTDLPGEIRKLWTPYFRWLVAHPNETIFYHRFRDGPGFYAFDKQRDISYFASFIQIVHAFDDRLHIFQRVSADLLWLHVLTSTVMYAKYVVEGVLPADAATEETIFRLMLGGLSSLLTD